MKKLLYITLLLTSVMQLQACKKADQLTPETQTGANTFSCKINGVIFKPGYQELFGPTPLIGVFSISNGINEFSLSASNQQLNPYQSIDFNITGINSVGTFDIKNDQLSFVYTSSQYNLPIYTNSTNTGTLTVTKFDMVNHIVSGTFNFTVASKGNPSNTVQVTEGRFDITTKN